MAKLKDLLTFQRDNAEKLEALLEGEMIAITQRQSTDIERIAKDKVSLIDTLSQTDTRIAQHPDLPSLESDDELASIVTHIKSTIERCQAQNALNGEALNRAQISFNKMRNLMQQSQGKAGMTYNAEGRTSNLSTLGTNIKA